MGAVGGVAILGGNFEAPTFPEDKVVQRSLTAGTQESSAIDAIILDALPLGAPGQLDSHAFLWKGHSNDGSPHTIDWKAFVNVTANDGTGSLWTLQTRIDGAGYTDILTVDDNGLLTVSGATFTMDQLIIDADNTEAVLIRKDGDAGDVFIVDTVNDVVRLGSDATFLTFGASSDTRLERVGPRILRMREPGVGGVGLGAGGENTLQLYARDDVGAARFLELKGDGPLAQVKATRSAGGGQFDLIFDVDVGRLAFFNEGVQRWNIQGSVSEDFEFAPFITNRYDLGSATFAVRNLYTHGVIFGTTPSSTGTIRLQNADEIKVRNFADGADLNVVSFSGTDDMTLGDIAMGNIVIPDGPILFVDTRLRIREDSTSALQVTTQSGVTHFIVDTSGENVSVSSLAGGGTFVITANPLIATGQQDSGAFIITGHSFDVGAHTIDWKQFVNVTADDGTGSIFTLQTRIDAAGFATVFQIDDAGNLTIPGSFTVDGLIIDVDSTEAFLVRKDGDAGDVFTVDTVNDLVTVNGTFAALGVGPHAFGAPPSTDVRNYFSGTFVGQGNGTLANVWVDGNLTGGSGDTDGIFGNLFDSNLRTQTETEFIDSMAELVVGTGNMVNNLTGGGEIENAAALLIPGLPTVGVDNAMIYLGGIASNFVQQVGTYDAIRIDQANRGANGFDDSGKIIFTGVARNGGPPIDADWQQFVQMTANDATESLFTFQTRIDAAGYVTALTISDTGVLNALGIGPHAFGALAPSIGDGSDRRMYLAGNFVSTNTSNAAAHLWVDGNLTGDRFDEDGLFGTILDTHIITQTETEDIGIIAQLILADPTITDNLTGTIFQAAVLAIPRPPTEGDENAAIFIGSNGGPLSQASFGTYDAIRIDQGNRFNAGFNDSGKIIFTGVSHDGSPHDADWQQFVQMTANAGTGSLFTFQTRIDAASYATVFQIEDNGIRVFGGSNFNGQFTATTMATALVSTPSGSSATAVGLIPAGSFVVGITVRVTTTVTGPSGFDIGDGIDVDRWGNSIAVASGTTTDITDFTSGAVTNFPVANDVVITSDGVDFTGGVVRITVHYQTLNPATS